MNALLSFPAMHHVCAVPLEAISGRRIPLGLVFQTFLTESGYHQVGTEEQTFVLWKSCPGS